MSHNIHDDILCRLVPPNACEHVETELSQPKSRLDSLLSAADLDNIVAMDEATRTLSARDVPGGTISFLFEKTSVSALNGVEED
jgi:DNA repair and recombination protein RAD54B